MGLLLFEILVLKLEPMHHRSVKQEIFYLFTELVTGIHFEEQFVRKYP